MTFQNDSEKTSASRLSLVSLRLLKYRQCEVPFFWERWWCHLQKKFQRCVFVVKVMFGDLDFEI